MMQQLHKGHLGRDSSPGAQGEHKQDKRMLAATIQDRAFKHISLLAALAVLALVVVIVYQLTTNAWEAISRYRLGFVLSSVWDPVFHDYGALPFVFGTVVSSLLALLIAVPLSLGVAIFLSEIATAKLRRPIIFLVEVLASIPSVIYGLWGLFVLVPLVRQSQPFFQRWFGFLPIFQGPPFGYSLLAAAIILAIMIIPTITSLSRDALAAVPNHQREASYALGASHWETIKNVVLPYNKSGIIAAVMLGLGRALGETMAVTMVIGNMPQISASLFMPAQTMASLIANEFGEAVSPLHVSALMEIGLLLFLVTLLINVLAKFLTTRTKHKGVQK